MTKDIMPAKDVCDHSRENNKAIQRQFKKKKKTKQVDNCAISVDWKIQYCKDTNSPQMLFRLNATVIKIPMGCVK